MPRFIDMLNDQAKAEDMQAMSMRGIGEADADDFLEKAYWESPEEAQVVAGEQNFNEPEKAVPLAQSVTVAKEAGQQGGIGIVPAIFAGLAGAFSDDGVATTSKLMKEWDPARQKAVATKRQGELQKIEAERLEMDRTAQGRDPESDLSRAQMKDYAGMFDQLGMPELGSMFVGKSMEQQDKMFQSLAPQLKDAIGKDERQLNRDIKVEYNRKLGEQSKAKIEAARISSQAKAQAKVDAAVLADENKVKAGAKKTQDALDKQTNATLLKEYEILGALEAKYKATSRDTDRIIELGGLVKTGPIVGSTPAVWLRTMFTDSEDLQELESLIKGLPLPILKATFGAQFTVREGETLAQSLANIKMSGETFRNRMIALKEDSDRKHNEYVAQTAHRREYGNLLGYESNIPMRPEPVNYKEGQTATGPDGQRMIFTNGSWEAQ